MTLSALTARVSRPEWVAAGPVAVLTLLTLALHIDAIGLELHGGGVLLAAPAALLMYLLPLAILVGSVVALWHRVPDSGLPWLGALLGLAGFFVFGIVVEGFGHRHEDGITAGFALSVLMAWLFAIVVAGALAARSLRRGALLGMGLAPILPMLVCSPISRQAQEVWTLGVVALVGGAALAWQAARFHRGGAGPASCSIAGYWATCWLIGMVGTIVTSAWSGTPGVEWRVVTNNAVLDVVLAGLLLGVPVVAGSAGGVFVTRRRVA